MLDTPSAKLKQVILSHPNTRSGKLRLWVPEDWSEDLIQDVLFTVNRDMDYIDTVYYLGTLMYNQRMYTITGAMCLYNPYPQTPGFTVRVDRSRLMDLEPALDYQWENNMPLYRVCEQKERFVIVLETNVMEDAVKCYQTLEQQKIECAFYERGELIGSTVYSGFLDEEIQT